MIGGTRQAELARTAELLVDIASDQGMYFALQYLRDIGYDGADIDDLLRVLINMPSANVLMRGLDVLQR